MKSVVQGLRDVGVVFDDGLSDSEISQIQQLYGIQFPPDLRELLQVALPIEWARTDTEAKLLFPDWRNAYPAEIRWDWLHRPFDGIAFDVVVNDYWFEKWGARPEDQETAVAHALDQLAKAPRLIPVFAHRYIPERPHKEGNPVFSVVGSDVICYGQNLVSYLVKEFGIPFPQTALPPLRRIEFWSDIAEE